MYRDIETILNDFKVTNYVHQYHAYDSGQTIGFVDPHDPESAVWYRLHPGSFWYFDGRTTVDFMHRQAQARDIHAVWWKEHKLPCT